MLNNLRHIIIAVTALFIVSQTMSAGEGLKYISFYHTVITLQDSAAPTGTSVVDPNSSRRTTALIYSCVMPGAGQTMLGHTYKGLGFTLSAFGSVLTALISHNNFVARNERLDALEYQYSNATNWVSAEVIYGAMREAHTQMVSDRDRRNLFLGIAAVIWTANIVDVLYNTEDEGETLFSLSPVNPSPAVEGVVAQHNPFITVSLRLP
jgi:hypothetical protein